MNSGGQVMTGSVMSVSVTEDVQLTELSSSSVTTSVTVHAVQGAPLTVRMGVADVGSLKIAPGQSDDQR